MEGEGAFENGRKLLLGFAFLFVTAFFQNSLWQHAVVTDDGDAVLNDCTYFFELTYATFEFDHIGACLHKRLGCGECLGRRVVAIDRHIADDEGAVDTTRDGSGVVGHHFQGDMSGVWEAEHNHAE